MHVVTQIQKPPTVYYLSAWLPEEMAEPEVHVIGQLRGASGFESENAFCVFEVKHGPAWSLLGGESEGQTQTDYAQVPTIRHLNERFHVSK